VVALEFNDRERLLPPEFCGVSLALESGAISALFCPDMVKTFVLNVDQGGIKFTLNAITVNIRRLVWNSDVCVLLFRTVSEYYDAFCVGDKQNTREEKRFFKNPLNSTIYRIV